MLALRITYASPGELHRDLEGQLQHGGILVRVAAGAPGARLRDPVRLDIVTPGGETVSGEGEVLHIGPDGGVAVTFPAAGVQRLRELARLPVPEPPAPAQARHEVVDMETSAATGAPRPGELSTSDRIQLALHGDEDDRAAILRDKNRMLHPYVLRNPKITLDEVQAIARTHTNPEVLGMIAGNRDWVGRGPVAAALVRNTRTPHPAGLRALDHVPAADLRQIAKTGAAPPHIVAAARKKVIS